jgi:GT2 family glycosyltransferase
VNHARIDEHDVGASEAIASRVILVQAAQNRGYSAGNNLGIRVALARGAAYVLILNNDTLVSESFLEPLVAHGESHGDVGALGPKVLDLQGRIDRNCARRRLRPLDFFFLAGMGRRLFPNNRWKRRHIYEGEYWFVEPKEVDVLSGCCILVRRSTIMEVGLLDEGTFLNFEEFILHEQLRSRGQKSVIVPDSVIVHKVGQSTSRQTSAFLSRVSRESQRYYLTAHRRYPKPVVAMLMALAFSPKAYGLGLMKVLAGGQEESCRGS